MNLPPTFISMWAVAGPKAFLTVMEYFPSSSYLKHLIFSFGFDFSALSIKNLMSFESISLLFFIHWISLWEGIESIEASIMTVFPIVTESDCDDKDKPTFGISGTKLDIHNFLTDSVGELFSYNFHHNSTNRKVISQLNIICQNIYSIWRLLWR